MKYGSICSGVAPQTKAWKALGLECAWFSEIEPFPSAVLKHHFPEIPNLGDFTKIDAAKSGAIDLLVGGTPCQAFSVAGKRAGLDDPRGNLTLEFVRLAARTYPRWILWENVPGVLSIDSGRTFAEFLGFLAGRKLEVPREGWGNSGAVPGYGNAYGLAYRILDAQFFGVAQRRRRVFVVGCLGDWRAAAAVLFERESLSGNPAPSREKRQGTTYATAPSLTASGRGVERSGESRGQDPVVAHTITRRYDSSSNGDEGGTPIVAWPAEIAPTLNAQFGDKQGLEDQHALGGAGLFVPTFAIQSVNMVRERKQNGIGISDEEVMYTVTGRDQHAVAFAENQRGELRTSEIAPQLSCAGGKPGSGYPAVAIPINTQIGLRGAETSNTSREGVGIGNEGDPMFTLQENHGHAVAFADRVGTLRADAGMPKYDSDNRQLIGQGMAVRRLTPRECERLQGMEDDYTLIPWRGKMAPDGPRYKAIGNSWAVPVLNWLARRIKQVEASNQVSHL
jgi:DNA (cytosine-5)-methyltransferase 1